MNEQGTDGIRFFESHMFPGSSGIHAFVNTVPETDIATHFRFTHSCVKDIGVTGSDGNGSCRGTVKGRIADAEPCLTGIRGLPDAAAHGTEIVDIRLIGDTGYGQGPSAAPGTDVTPVQSVIQQSVEARRMYGRDRFFLCFRRLILDFIVRLIISHTLICYNL